MAKRTGKRRRTAHKKKQERLDRKRELVETERNEWSRWKIALRNALGTGLASVLLSLPFKFFGLVPDVVVVRLFAIVTVISAVVYAIRTEMHLHILLREGSKGRAHEVVVGLEILVALAFLAFGPYCFLWPDGTVQFLGALVLLIALFVLALAAAWLSDARDVRTGTNAANDCGFIIFVRIDILKPADQIRFFKWLNKRWDIVAEKGKISYLSIWLCAVLISVVCANGPHVAPAVYKFLLKEQHEAQVVLHDKAAVSKKHVDPPPGPPATAGVEPIVDVQSAVTGPSYEDLCPSGPIPGDPAPEPERLQLYRRWLAGGLGAIFAACAIRASRLPTGSWYAPGYCGKAVRSLALATPMGESGMVLWDAAEFALERAEDGSLLNLTSGESVEGGEMYTVETNLGTYTFLQRELPHMAGTVFQSCHEVPHGGPIVKLPPALGQLWAAFVVNEGTWLWPLSDRTAQGAERIVFDDPRAGDREIVGYCRTDIDCELRVDGVAQSVGSSAFEMDQVIDSIT